jgi:DNA-binding MarR family transcriptional regulator
MTTTPTAMAHRGFRLRIGSPDDVALSVVMAPHKSILALLWRAACGHRADAPTSLVHAVQRSVRPSAQFALYPLRGRPPSRHIPECMTPIQPRTDVSVTEEVDCLRQLPGEVLQRQLQAIFDGNPPARWQPALERPGPWFRALAHASLDAWAVSAPRWRAAGPLLDREIRRVGTAVVRGSTDALLNSLHPRIRYSDGTLTFASTHDCLAELSGRQLVLLPMIVGPDQLFASFDQPQLAYLAYPIRKLPAGHQSPNDALTLVLGAPRAALLRALRRPLAAAQLAQALQCAPSTATYHCQQLEAAGLITRETFGRTVQITRTTRGAELVDLLSDGPTP